MSESEEKYIVKIAINECERWKKKELNVKLLFGGGKAKEGVLYTVGSEYLR